MYVENGFQVRDLQEREISKLSEKMIRVLSCSEATRPKRVTDFSHIDETPTYIKVMIKLLAILIPAKSRS